MRATRLIISLRNAVAALLFLSLGTRGDAVPRHGPHGSPGAVLHTESSVGRLVVCPGKKTPAGALKVASLGECAGFDPGVQPCRWTVVCGELPDVDRAEVPVGLTHRFRGRAPPIVGAA